MMRRAFVGVLAQALWAFAGENYAQWPRHLDIVVNTSATGADLAESQRDFPLPIRLNAGNFDFTKAAPGGADVRFSKPDGTRLPYEIERWDALRGVAEIWVLADQIKGGGNTVLRMYYGKSNAADSSNGPAVFKTSAGFQGVFHMGATAGDTIRDVTANGFKGVPVNKGRKNPAPAEGAVGMANNFFGNNNDNSGGAYKLITSSGGNTQDPGPLNFQNDSSTVNGLPAYTVSAWINIDVFPDGIDTRKGIVAKSAGKNGKQYQLRMLDPAVNQIDNSLDTNRVEFADGPAAVYKNGTARLTAGAWFHVAAVRSGPVGVPGNLKVYVNGANPGLSTNNFNQTTQSPFDVYIGGLSDESGFFGGRIDEVVFANTARDSSWLKLTYATQRPDANCVTVGGPAASKKAVKPKP